MNGVKSSAKGKDAKSVVACCERPVSVAPLDLSKVPTEAQLMAAGGEMGPLDTLGNADEADFKERLARSFGLASVAEFDRLSTQAEAVFDATGSAVSAAVLKLSQARKRVKRLRKINHEFGTAINLRNARKFTETARLMREHLDKFPDSPWAGEAMLHLSLDATYTGRPAEAQARLQTLMDVTTEDPASPTWEIRCKAKGSWANLDLQLGQYESAIPKLENIVATDTSSHRRTWASMWLTQARLRLGVKAQPGFKMMRACGSEALGLILVGLNKKSAAQRVEKIVPPHPDGFSLEEIARIANRNGVPMRGFRVATQARVGSRAAQLAKLPLPLIIHYDMARYGGASKATFGLKSGGAARAFAISTNADTKGQTVVPHCPDCPPVTKTGTQKTAKAAVKAAVSSAFRVRSVGHFLVVRSVDRVRQTVTLEDPLLDSTYSLTFAQLEREWSGAGLMLDRSARKVEPLPARKDVRIAQLHLSALSSGDIELLDRAAMTKIRGGCCCPWIYGPTGPPEPSPLNPPSPVKPPCPPYGSPNVEVNPISMNTYIADIPVWYKTPIGPDVEPMLSYNSQDTPFVPAFGAKWRLSYESYATEIPGWSVIIGEGTGKFTTYRKTATGYAAPSGEFNSVSKTGTNRFEVTTPTGEKTIYDQPRDVNNNLINTTVVNLQEIRDRFGAALQLRYVTFIRSLGEGTTVTKIRLARIIDAQGKITVLQYDSNDRCTAIITTNTTTGDLNSSTARRATFGYDAAGNLTNVEDMGGNPFSYAYDSESVITKLGTEQGDYLFDHRFPGHNPFYGPGEANNETRVTDPQGGVKLYGMYLQIGGDYSGTARFAYYDANGRQHLSDYGARVDGQLHLISRETAGLPGRTDLTYDPATNQPNSVTDENGNTSRVTYNWQGLPTSTTAPSGQTTRLFYDASGLDVTQVKNHRGNTLMVASYTANHQPSSVTTYPTASATPAYTTSFTYTAWGAPLTVTNPSNETTTYNYDATTKRLTGVAVSSSTLASTTVANFSYDAIGRVQTATDAYGLSRRFDYNDLDKPIKVTYPDGSTEITDYVCCAIPGVTIDRSGRKTYRDYDELNRLRRVQDADGNTLQMDYDKVGNLIRLLDGRGSVTRWDYDAKDRLIRKIYADGSREGFRYDPASQLIRSYDARGQVTKQVYNPDGQLWGIDYPNQDESSSDVGFDYDNLGRLAVMSDGLGTTTWSYDNLGRVLGEDGPWGGDTVTYTYDEQGRRKTSGISGSNTSTYNYDSLGRLSYLSAAAGTWNWSYVGGSGLPSLMVAPNGVRTSYGYDTLERLRSVQNLKNDATTVLSKYGYNFDDTLKKDARAQLTRQSRDTAQTLDALQTLTFGYNATDQLTGETSGETNPLTKLTRTFDPMGNWQSATDQGRDTATTGIRNTSQSFTSNRLNQLTGINTSYTDGSTGTNAISYDSRGNVKQSRDSKSASYSQYFFDDVNRLVRIVVRRASDNVILSQTTFVYDGLGRRKVVVEQNVVSGAYLNTRRVSLVYDGMDVVRESEENWATAGDTATKTTTTYQLTRTGNIGGILARTRQISGQADRHSFYSYDGTGNVVSVTDASQNVQCAYGYSGFGLEKVQEASGWGQPYRYSTKWQHPNSGLVDYGFRFYNPGWGRWINRDPIREAGGSNLYGMVGNNPVNAIDAYGLNPFVVGAIVIGGAYMLGQAIAPTAANAPTSSTSPVYGHNERFVPYMGDEAQITTPLNNQTYYGPNHTDPNFYSPEEARTQQYHEFYHRERQSNYLRMEDKRYAELEAYLATFVWVKSHLKDPCLTKEQRENWETALANVKIMIDDYSKNK